MPKVMFLATFCLKLLIVYYTYSSNVGRHMLPHQGRLKGKMSSLTKNVFALVPIIQIFFCDFENCFTGNTRNVVVIQ